MRPVHEHFGEGAAVGFFIVVVGAGPGAGELDEETRAGRVAGDGLFDESAGDEVGLVVEDEVDRVEEAKGSGAGRELAAAAGCRGVVGGPFPCPAAKTCRRGPRLAAAFCAAAGWGFWRTHFSGYRCRAWLIGCGRRGFEEADYLCPVDRIFRSVVHICLYLAIALPGPEGHGVLRGVSGT